jgi:hypothetical protein
VDLSRKAYYLVETLIADTWVMKVYEVCATGERKTIGVPKKTSRLTDRAASSWGAAELVACCGRVSFSINTKG